MVQQLIPRKITMESVQNCLHVWANGLTEIPDGQKNWQSSGSVRAALNQWIMVSSVWLSPSQDPS